MKTESGQSDTRERGFVSNQGQSFVSATQAAVSKLAASDPTFASDVPAAIDQANAHQPAVSNSQSASSNLSASLEPATGSKIPFWLIGLLLTATAIAKLWMLLSDPFADVRVGLPREILWLSVAFELWLAFENFQLRDHRVMAFVNTVVFASFAIFASVRLAMGYASCGCSGSLELPAWFFIFIDFAIVAWFTVSANHPAKLGSGFGQLLKNWSGWSPEKRGRLVGLAVFAGLFGGFQLPIALPLRIALLGESPIKAVVRMDKELRIGRTVTGFVDFHNRSNEPAKIVGVSISCGCVSLAQDPTFKVFPASEKVSLPLVIRPNKPGKLHHRVTLILDHSKQFRVDVDVLGSVKGEE